MIGNNDGLKRCPFCWGEADTLEQVYGYLVRCRECLANIKVFSSYREQAIATWNHREPEVHSETKNESINEGKQIECVDVQGLTMNEYVKFFELYRSKKTALNTEEIVNLWNRFITKPSQFVTYKMRKKSYE